MVCKSNKYAHLVLLPSLNIVFDLNQLDGEGPAKVWFADGLGAQSSV